MVRQNTKGYEKIVSLFDSGTFVELGAYLRREGSDGAYDAVICGYGAINSKLTYAFVQDSDRTGGAMDEIGAKKIERLYEQAIMCGAPVIGVFDSNGAVVYDGTAALSAYGRAMKCVSDASGVILQVAYVSGVSSGMSAMLASMFDITVSVDGVSEIYLDHTNKFDLNKISSVCTPDTGAAVEKIRQIITLLPANNNERVIDPATDDPARAVASGLTGNELVSNIADNGSYIKLSEGIAKELVTAFASVGGVLCGIIASNSAVDGGKLTSKGAKKAAKMVKFCDAYNIPVVTLVDSMGIADTACSCAPSAYAKLSALYLRSTTAKVTVVTGNAYGPAFVLLGSRSLGADVTLAVDGAHIGVLDPERAVAFLWNDKITQEKSRGEVENEWTEQYASAELAAEKGDIDDIIPAEELRARISSALYMLASKTDTVPAKKHLSMSL